MDRVQKILSNSGFCSRRRAEELIKEGKVQVNGKTIKIGSLAGIKDKITVDGKLIKQDKKVYIMLNKPVGCVTALRDQKYPTVADLININERVFPVGRLDLNTSGLLLMTNDGDFANNVAHPSQETNKTYRVKLSGKITKDKIKQLERGVMLADGKTSPAKVVMLKPSIIEITIHEGKNRIIRRMMKKVGFHVTALERIAIGRLELRSLKSGKWRHLKEYEKEKIFQNKGAATPSSNISRASKKDSKFPSKKKPTLAQAAKLAEEQMQEEEKRAAKKHKSRLSKEEQLKRRYQTKSTKDRGYKRSPREADGKKPKDLIFPHSQRRRNNALRAKAEEEIIRSNRNKPVSKQAKIKAKLPSLPKDSSFARKENNKRKAKRSKQSNRSQAIAGKKKRSNADTRHAKQSESDTIKPGSGKSFSDFQQSRKAKSIRRRKKPNNGFDKLRKNAKHQG